MRVVVLALTLALAACQQNFAPDFAAGKTYVYKYETWLLGGLPEEGLGRAGLKVRSKVLISAIEHNMLMLKLAEPEFFEYSGVWPKDAFTPATKLTSVLAPQLMIPIKFEYSNGVVGKMFAPEGVSVMVLNIYRGILSVLQLNVKKTQNVYEMQEAGAQGVCKTFYAITEDDKAERILLTKTRDLNHCQERIVKDIGLAYTETCAKCQRDSKTVKGATAYNYVLKSVPNGIMILDASVNEVIQFTPFKEMNGATQMETKQHLVFVEVQNSPLMPVKAEYRQRGSVQYEFSTELLQTPIQLVKVTNLQTQIEAVLSHIVANNVERVHDDAPLRFWEFIQLLRMAKLEDLQMVWRQHKTNPAYRQWILDTLPSVGTPVALRFIIQRFEAAELSTVEVAQALIASVHMVTANHEAIQLFDSLRVNPKIKTNPVLNEIVLLGYGTMVSKYCADKPVCPVELVKPIHTLLAESVSKGETWQMISILKVLSNAGHPMSLKPITKVLPIHGTAATSLPTRVHAEAIMALRNIAKKEPRLVQEMALQLYMDKALHPELRMLACIVIFETRPAVGLVTSLANLLKMEENLQVASFTYSHMKSLTRSTAPNHASIAAACSVGVKILSKKFERLSLRFSRAIQMDLYSNPFMLGAAVSTFYINDAATLLPRAIVAKTSAYIAGAAADIFEVGVRTEGLQEALLKSHALADDVNRITKMKRVIKALSDWRAMPNSKPLASIYVKFFGQEIAFADINQDLIKQAITLASGPSVQDLGRDVIKSLLSGASFHVAKPVLATEVRRIMPTAAGFPMELGLYTAAVAVAVGKIKATATPALPEPIQFRHLLKTNIELMVDIKPSVVANMFAVMGVNTAILQAAVLSRAKINSIVPASISARVDINEGQYKIAALPVSAPEHVVAIEVESIAVVRNVEDIPNPRITPLIPAEYTRPTSKEILTSKSSSGSVSAASSEILRDMARDVHPIRRRAFSKKYSFQVYGTGLRGCFRVATDNAAFVKDIPLYRMAGNHSASLSVKKNEDESIERLEMLVQVGPKAAEKIIKKINLAEDEVIEGRPVLMKLKKLLNGTSSSSSSSSSKSSSSSVSSRSRRTSSKSSVSKSSSSSSSRSVSKRSSSSSSSSRRSRVAKSSSASSLESLFSASSRSSRSSRRTSKRVNKRTFQQNHKMFHAGSSSQKSRSSASSFEAIYNKNKFLGTENAPAFAVILQAVRTDGKLQGYQITGYADKTNARLQLILAALAADNNWRLCADGVLLSKHKATAKIAWGQACKQYDLTVTAETGLLGPSPAARLRMTWNQLPVVFKRYAKKAYDYIPAYVLESFIRSRDNNSVDQLSFTVAATSERTLDLIFKTPTRSIYKLALRLPLALPLDEITGLTPFDDLADKVRYLISKAAAAECSSIRDTVTTFNNRKYKNEMPQYCYQILAQDCSEEMKFMVLLRKDDNVHNHINVKIADIDIDLYLRDTNVVVKVNGREVPTSHLPYQHPTAKIEIRPNKDGISVYAPSLGLHEVYFDKNSWKIKVADWIKGQTCGLCGKADGEIRQEYRTSNGRVTKNAVSFAHSWVLPAENCRDTTECRMKVESVQLEKKTNVQGQESKCFSVEPVLRCLPGCLPIKTTAVTVGFHCLAKDAAVIPQDFYNYSVDMRETTQAHLACSCTPQCA
ncbi:vitellogenin-1-like isoform X2 [Hippocampus comes]|uniref:vitellogenin-1-like isoform X2 n=1 Tax=Hippocampus comes TaxID=109280 RepID=UPI00094E16D1|nr:PREDICTED: vitellogenin-1-like isoform X2 [Hippocampus comes]